MASIMQRDPSRVSLHARCLWEPQTGAASSVVIKIGRYNKNKRKCERTLYAHPRLAVVVVVVPMYAHHLSVAPAAVMVLIFVVVAAAAAAVVVVVVEQ